MYAELQKLMFNIQSLVRIVGRRSGLNRRLIRSLRVRRLRIRWLLALRLLIRRLLKWWLRAIGLTRRFLIVIRDAIVSNHSPNTYQQGYSTNQEEK
jgi:hypothetical protein